MDDQTQQISTNQPSQPIQQPSMPAGVPGVPVAPVNSVSEPVAQNPVMPIEVPIEPPVQPVQTPVQNPQPATQIPGVVIPPVAEMPVSTPSTNTGIPSSGQ